ncbi:hypothetical protein BRYFOR_09913 [Marvinbryantia formatexigens DSM 14469]|uniref:Uncharacterized protein n=1 Tax=Marvinbryantia formatexigens DSM 14469 TaxID=478749 RepID=C6LML2_9FIRM|nr:hypothetical protein BRYFOR_09913 [Marvinbryantia formatexigens DSM 14469]
MHEDMRLLKINKFKGNKKNKIVHNNEIFGKVPKNTTNYTFG